MTKSKSDGLRAFLGFTAAAYFRMRERFFCPKLSGAVNTLLHEAVWVICGSVITLAISCFLPKHLTDLEGLEFFVFGIAFHAGLVIVTAMFGGMIQMRKAVGNR